MFTLILNAAFQNKLPKIGENFSYIWIRSKLFYRIFFDYFTLIYHHPSGGVRINPMWKKKTSPFPRPGICQNKLWLSGGDFRPLVYSSTGKLPYLFIIRGNLSNTMRYMTFQFSSSEYWSVSKPFWKQISIF